MGKLNKTIYLIIFTAAIIAGDLMPANFAWAQGSPGPDPNDLKVIFTPNPLFQASNFLPGESRTGSAEVFNNSGEKKRIAVEAINVAEKDRDGAEVEELQRLSSALTLEIKEGETTLYDDALSNFFDRGEVYILSKLDSGTAKTYAFTVSFWSGANNSFQGKTLSFDILIGFQGEDGGIAPGASSSLPSGLTISNEPEAITVSGDSVTINWLTSYKSTSRVIFSKAGEPHTLDLTDNADTPPKYGYTNSTPETDNDPPIKENGVTFHTVIIDKLLEGTVYYYRAISHASPPTISRERSFTTLAMSDDGNENDNGSGNSNTDDSANGSALDGETHPNPSQEGNSAEADGVSDLKDTGLIPSVREAVNSAGNFTGSVLGSSDETGEGAASLGNGQENKIKSGFGRSSGQILLFAILLLSAVIISWHYVYRSGRKRNN